MLDKCLSASGVALKKHERGQDVKLKSNEDRKLTLLRALRFCYLRAITMCIDLPQPLGVYKLQMWQGKEKDRCIGCFAIPGV